MAELPVRRPYTGSCHCKATRFVVYLTLPAEPIASSASSSSSSSSKKRTRGTQHFYRCNCTLCHKAGLLHVRVLNPPEDFRLLSPLDPLAALGDYQGSRKGWIHFFFCKTCGMRCFSFGGEGEVEEVEDVHDGGEKSRVWHPKTGWAEGHGKGKLYLSVNAHAIDAGQEGFDMREWTDKKCLWYLNNLEKNPREMESTDGPFPGGCY